MMYSCFRNWYKTMFILVFRLLASNWRYTARYEELFIKNRNGELGTNKQFVLERRTLRRVRIIAAVAGDVYSSLSDAAYSKT